MSDWRNKAILVRLSLGAWSGNAGQRKCRALAAEMEQQHGTQRNKLKADAELLSREDRMTVQGIVSKARAYYYAHTVPWDDRGWRMLPAKLFMEFKETMASFADDLEAAVQRSILDRYEELREKARRGLNGLADAVPFPSYEKLKAKYRWQLGLEQLPRPEDLRVECLADYQMEELRAQMKERQDKQLQAAVAKMVEEIRKLLANLVEQISKRNEARTGDERRTPLHDSLIENLREVCRIMPTLNVGDDPFLANLIHKVDSELTSYDADSLRHSWGLRDQLKDKASSILSELANYAPNVENEEVDCDAATTAA